MSHQVKLCTQPFTDLRILKEAIQDLEEQGITINESGFYDYSGYKLTPGTKWGSTNSTIVCGINLPTGRTGQRENTPMGIVDKGNGTYEIVGDSYGLRYKNSYGLTQAIAEISQRYTLREQQETVIKEMEAKFPGSQWTVTEFPTGILTDKKQKLKLVIEEVGVGDSGSGMSVGGLA